MTARPTLWGLGKLEKVMEKVTGSHGIWRAQKSMIAALLPSLNVYLFV